MVSLVSSLKLWLTWLYIISCYTCSYMADIRSKHALLLECFILTASDMFGKGAFQKIGHRSAEL